MFDFMVSRSRFAGLTRVRNGSNYSSAGLCSSVGVGRLSRDECGFPLSHTQKCCRKITCMLHRYFLPAWNVGFPIASHFLSHYKEVQRWSHKPKGQQRPIFNHNKTCIIDDIIPRTPLVVAVVVLTLTHRYNAVRGHSTGSNNSRAEITSGVKQIKTD